jgi:hypothetical protein
MQSVVGRNLVTHMNNVYSVFKMTIENTDKVAKSHKGAFQHDGCVSCTHSDAHVSHTWQLFPSGGRNFQINNAIFVF